MSEMSYILPKFIQKIYLNKIEIIKSEVTMVSILKIQHTCK